MPAAAHRDSHSARRHAAGDRAGSPAAGPARRRRTGLQLHAGFTLARRRGDRALSARAGHQPRLLLALSAGQSRQHARLRPVRPQPDQSRAGRRAGLSRIRRRARPSTAWATFSTWCPTTWRPARRTPGGTTCSKTAPTRPYAHFFDIDWHPIKPELADKLLLPILGKQYGEVLEERQLTIEFRDGAFLLRYFDGSARS